MNDEVKELKDDARAQRPRSPRVPVNFSVGLEWRTASGENVTTQAVAVRVSRGGATLSTDARVSVGDSVRVTPPFGRTLEAEVNGVWNDEEDGSQRVGVKLLDPHGWFAE
ncbi:MAG: PilZ domain-containing protein [Pyrinomonadaceae bacterium]